MRFLGLPAGLLEALQKEPLPVPVVIRRKGDPALYLLGAVERKGRRWPRAWTKSPLVAQLFRTRKAAKEFLKGLTGINPRGLEVQQL